MLLRLINLDVCHIKRAYCARFFLWLARMPDMTLFQKILIFYAVMAVISFLITWFLTHDKKRIRFLSAFLVGATWPISFPVALLFSLF
ncbi:GhoT/OrtT family toxin [Salmonella enterica subsp. enterica serovar Napoli]|nr:GhoT/OrtT family toxin [Salmonella enterica subsp. enterica serovar Napoli]